MTGPQAASDAGAGAVGRPHDPPVVTMPAPEAGALPRGDAGATFDWPETKPGEDRSCQGGTYTGRWMCNTFGIFPFEGDVKLQFVESMDGEFLELSDGQLGGLVGEGEFRFDGKLVGRLDCATREFSAQIEMGQYERYEPLTDAYELVGYFEGTLKGSLDPAQPQIKGEWSLLADVLADCIGPWTASLSP